MAGTASSVASLGTAWVDNVFDKAAEYFRTNSVMSNLVLNFGDRQGDEARTSTSYNQLSAGTISETADASYQEFTVSAIATLTPDEIVAAGRLTDRRVETEGSYVIQSLASELGNAAVDKVEADLLGDFANLTGGTIGSGGTGDPMTWGKLLAARAHLAAKAEGPYIAVIHENAWFNLAKSVSPAVTASAAPESLKDKVSDSYYVGSYGDLSIYTTTRLAAGTAVTQGVFASDALAIDWRRSFRLETQRSAIGRAEDLVLSAKYGHGVWRPKKGIKVISDASLPTG